MVAHKIQLISLTLALLSLSACPSTKLPAPPDINNMTPISPRPLLNPQEQPSPALSSKPKPILSPSNTMLQTPSPTPSPAPPQEIEPSPTERPQLKFPGDPKLVSQIHIIPSIRTIAHKNESTVFSLLIKDVNNLYVDPQKVNIVWSVKHPELFSVDLQGKATALTPSGYTDIVATQTSSGISGSAEIIMGSSGGAAPSPTPALTPTPTPTQEPIKKLATVNWASLVSDPEFNHGAGAIGPAATESLRGLALSKEGTKVYGGYILCCGLNRIREYSAITGAYTNQEDGNTGVPPASFAGRDFPKDIETDQAGNIYITTSNADRIAVYTSTNTLNSGVSFFVNLPLDTDYDTSSEERPEGLSVQGNNLYVSTVTSDLIYRYSLPLSALSTPVETIPVAGAGGLKGLEVDSKGNIYAVDSGTKNIIKIDPVRNQTTIATLASTPRYIALGPTEQLYITTSQSIEVYNTEGVFQESLGVNTAGIITKDFYGIDIDALGNIYITNAFSGEPADTVYKGCAYTYCL